MKVNSFYALNYMAELIHKESEARGFDGKQLQFGTHLMRVVSELGEALEADRVDKHADLKVFYDKIRELRGHEYDADFEEENADYFDNAFEEIIKDTVEDELTDALIMILYLCEEIGMDIDTHLQYKMMYNTRRAPRNGKRY